MFIYYDCYAGTGANGEQRIQNILSAIPLTSLFTLLGSVDESVTSATCKVLDKLLRPMSYEEISSSGLKVCIKK